MEDGASRRTRAFHETAWNFLLFLKSIVLTYEPKCPSLFASREEGNRRREGEIRNGKSRGLVANTSGRTKRDRDASGSLYRAVSSIGAASYVLMHFPSSLLRRRRFKRRSIKESIRSKLHRRFALEPIDFNIEIPRGVIDRAIRSIDRPSAFERTV